MLNKTNHEIHMRGILSALFSHHTLATQLAFKGGTCLYFFYGLDRFSTDLDFNALTDNLDIKAIDSEIQQYAVASMTHTNKRSTWFWLLSYQKNAMNIKLEISKRDYPDTYELKELLGVRICCMTRDCMFAHKLCAITDRKKLANRDLYDALFMFREGFEINEAIVQMRTGQTVTEYLGYLIEFIERTVNEKNILAGLGEVLSQSQKDRAKTRLKPDLLFAIKNYLVSTGSPT
jgi:predicted nucleotidyltransferase component of viral defense system